MEQFLFDNLVQSLKEAKAIARGESPASRRIKITPPDVKGVREKIGLSQSEFHPTYARQYQDLAKLWEQHRRTPTGPAAVLLKIVQTAPDIAMKTLNQY